MKHMFAYVPFHLKVKIVKLIMIYVQTIIRVKTMVVVVLLARLIDALVLNGILVFIVKTIQG